jgi:3-methyladenine DNA glycosylase Tag
MLETKVVSCQLLCKVAFMGFDLTVMAKFDEKNITILIVNPKIQIPKAKIRGAIDNVKQVFQVSL